MINFAVWAPSEAAFWQSWETAGIIEYVDGVRQYTSGYPGISTTAEGGWPGIIVKTPAVYDEEGNEVTPAVMVAGWHTNVRVYGSLEDQMTVGLDQYEEDGETLKDIFSRTWAVNIFLLTQQPYDPATGFPAGYRNETTGVTYADTRDFTSPSNVWA